MLGAAMHPCMHTFPGACPLPPHHCRPLCLCPGCAPVGMPFPKDCPLRTPRTPSLPSSPPAPFTSCLCSLPPDSQAHSFSWASPFLSLALGLSRDLHCELFQLLLQPRQKGEGGREEG